MDYNNEELKLTDFQIIISGIIFIIILLSIVIGYNYHLKLSGQTPFLTEKEAKDLTIFIKVIGLLAVIGFLYINVKSIDVFKAKGEKLTNAYLEVTASVLVLIAAIIVTFVVLSDGTNSLLAIENPEI